MVGPTLDIEGRRTLTIYGKPRAQPSKEGRVIKLGKGKHRVQMYTPADHPVWTWRDTVVTTLDAAELEPIEGPVMVTMSFFFERPQSHYRNGKFAHLLKPDAPKYPIAFHKNDVDNLQKAVFDCMTSRVFVDDSQVVGVMVSKSFTTDVMPEEGLALSWQRGGIPGGL